jgi:hypothetical protein
MELVRYEGKLPTTERRPRFRLSTEQARIVATLLEVDSALAIARVGPVVAAQTVRNGITIFLGPDARWSNGRGSAVSDAGGIVGISAEESALMR